MRIANSEGVPPSTVMPWLRNHAFADSVASVRAPLETLKHSTDALDVAKVAGIRQELQRISDVLAGRAKIFTLPTVTVTAGAAQPTGKTAGALDDKLQQRLKELQAEHRALDEALAMFQLQGTETVADLDRRVAAQMALEKRRVEVMRDVPKESPLRQVLLDEVNGIAATNRALDERKRLLQDAERFTQQYGDGTAAAARETQRLGELFASGAIDAGTYARALKATQQAADDQARAARGAAGGFDALIAGIEQGAADLARANSSFEIGKRMVNDLTSAVADFAFGAETDFGKVVLSFGRMQLQMELQAAASNLFNAVTGKGSTSQGLLGSLFSGLFSGGGSNAGGFAIVGSGAGSTNGVPNFMGMAGGGDTPVGEPFWVGEDGPELLRLDRPGHVYNRHQMPGGGGANVQVNVFNNSDAKVRARTSSGPGGAPRLDILVEAVEGALSSRLDRGQGSLAKVMSGRYGVQPAGR